VNELINKQAIQKKFNQAESFIKGSAYNDALNTLKFLEDKFLLGVDEKLRHQDLMWFLVKELKRMKILEINHLKITEIKELVELYISFARFKEAQELLISVKTIFETSVFNYLSLKINLGLNSDIEEYSIKNFLHYKKDLALSTEELILVYRQIGDYCLRKDNFELAIDFYEQEYELDPENPKLNLLLVILYVKRYDSITLHEKLILKAFEDDEETEERLRVGIELAKAKEELEKVDELSKKILSIFPDCDYSQYLIAMKEINHGFIDKGLKILQTLSLMNPPQSESFNSFLMMSHYSPHVSNAEIFQLANSYYENFILPFKKRQKQIFDFTSHYSSYQKKQIMKIGFVSGDIKPHPVFNYLKPILEGLVKFSVEIICYANNDQNFCSNWVSDLGVTVKYVKKLSDTELANLIYQDHIHILCDLSGHTALNRLNTFALKPSPIQITMLGHPSSTGLKEMDFITVDDHLIREDEYQFFSEKILKLDSAFPFLVDDILQFDINLKLARTDGFIVLGAVNNGVKLNAEVLSAWAEILREKINTVLIISNNQCSELSYQKYILEFFIEKGVDSSRISFEKVNDRSAYLERFQRLDICLDPFPFPGSTTTYETLMMAVPLITIEGKCFAHRLSSHLLKKIGLDELIAKDKNDYVEKIVKLISQPSRILEYKASLRELMFSKLISKSLKFPEEFLVKLEEIWRAKLNQENIVIAHK
jgi:predicted O-linked N-acetylglucosamine transferase (SPINDLY family)